MNRVPDNLHLLVVVISLCVGIAAASAQGTAFSYQGSLADEGRPVNGKYDLTFSLFNTKSGGSPLGGPLTNSAVAVSNGRFTVTMDFGAAFDGSARWLEIGVRKNGSHRAFTTLAPRQPLTPAPYAIVAGTAASAATVSGVVPGGGLSGSYPGLVTFSNAANVFFGAHSGNGGGLTNIPESGVSGLTNDLTAKVSRSGDVMSGPLTNLAGFVGEGSNLVHLPAPLVLRAEQFGMSPTNVDNSVQFKNALLALSQAAPAATVLYIPAGIYFITSPPPILNMTALLNTGWRTRTLCGDPDGTVIQCLATTAPWPQVAFLQTSGEPLNLKNIILKGPGANIGKICGYYHDGPNGNNYFENVTFFGWSWYGAVADDTFRHLEINCQYEANRFGLGLGYKCDDWTVEARFDNNSVGFEIGADTAVSIPGYLNLSNHWAGIGLGCQSDRFRIGAGGGNGILGVIGGNGTAGFDVSGYVENNSSIFQIGHNPNNPIFPTNAVEVFQNNGYGSFIGSVRIHDLEGVSSLSTNAIVTEYLPCALELDGNALPSGSGGASNWVQVTANASSIDRNSITLEHHGVNDNGGAGPSFDLYGGEALDTTHGIPELHRNTATIIEGYQSHNPGSSYQGPFWPYNLYLPSVDESGITGTGPFFAYWTSSGLGGINGVTNVLASISTAKTGTGGYSLTLSNVSLTLQGGATSGFLFVQGTDAPTAAFIGGQVGSVTNHLLKNVGGALIDYYSDGTTLWSKQLAP